MAPATTGQTVSELAQLPVPADGFFGPASGAVVDWWNSWNVDWRSPVRIETSNTNNTTPDPESNTNQTLLVVGVVALGVFLFAKGR